jgi:PAT family beta-lactamase induction signal transducer AmpG
MELYKTKKFYIYVSQIICGLLFALSVASMYTNHFFTISVVLFLLTAFFGATQDIAADGLYLQELSPKLQAQYVGWQGTFYNFAKLFSNGGMIFLVGIFMPIFGNTNAWAIIMAIYAVVMLCLGLYNRKFLPVTANQTTVKSASDVWLTLKDVIVSFFQKNISGMAFYLSCFTALLKDKPLKLCHYFLKQKEQLADLVCKNRL